MAEGDSSQVRVKLEQQNIKERLNLHVKRRLQQDPDVPGDNFDFPPGDNNGPTNLKRTKVKEAPKQRKPYQKRTDKAKTDTLKCKKGLKTLISFSDLIVKYLIYFRWTTWQPGNRCTGTPGGTGAGGRISRGSGG